MRSIEYQRVRVPRSAKRTALLLRTYGIGGAGAVIITLVVILVVLAPLLSPLGYRKIVARHYSPPYPRQRVAQNFCWARMKSEETC